MEILAIIALCLIAFFPTVNYEVIVDDIRQLDAVQRGCFAGAWTWKNFIHRLAGRLYGAGTFAALGPCKTCRGKREIPTLHEETVKSIPCPHCKATGKAWQTNLKVDHAFTLALHTTASVLIYLALGHNVTSLCAALLWAINPTNMQTSVWLNGRRYLVNIIIVLAMIALGPWAMPLYVFTPFFQPSAIFAPLVYGLWGLAFTAAMVIYAWPRWIRNRVDGRMKAITYSGMKKFSLDRVNVTIKTFGFYTLQMIVPTRPLLVYPFLADWGVTKKGTDQAHKIDGFWLAGALAMVTVVTGIFALHGNERMWLAFAALALLQQCNIIPATQTAADRYCSLPNVFVMYFVAKFAGPIGTLIILAYYLPVLMSALPMFRNINAYYDYHLFYDPNSVIVRKFKINWMLRTDDVMGAWELIKAGLIRNPEDFSMLYQATICLSKMGDAKMAIHYLDKAEKNHYIEQEALWRDHLKQIRNELTAHKNAGRVHPKDFAQGKR